MNRIALDELKQQIPLLEYLQAHDWQQAKPIGFGRLLGLCPLHADHKPSFLVDPHKNLFYCYVPIITPRAGVDGIVDSLHFAQHAIEMFRRSLPDGPSRQCLDRLSNRLTKVLAETRKLSPPK